MVETELQQAISGTQSASRSVVPAQIDRFTIERSLGRGSQGTVLLATNQRLSRKVALKLLRPLRRITLEPPEDDHAHVAFIAAFANAMGTAALAPQLAAANEQITKLATRSQCVWMLDQQHLVTAFEQANKLSLNYARLLKVSPTSQPSLVQLARTFTFNVEPIEPA